MQDTMRLCCGRVAQFIYLRTNDCINMGEFTPEEREVINSISRHHQADIDLATVAEIAASSEFSPYDVRLKMLENPGIHKRISPEIWAAMAVRQIRDAKYQFKQGNQEKFVDLMQSEYVASQGFVATCGLQLIKDVNEFWRFKPTIEAIFELDNSELEKADAYAKAYSRTAHKNAIQSHNKSLILAYQEWDHADLSTENINRGQRMYESCFKIFERGFPNLLALKRILDGETPELELLQEKSAAAVRRELTKDDPESNSVYFDLIVNSFDSNIRNAVAHNDIVTNPPESSVHIPTKGENYSYERFNEIVKANFANGVFLTGTFLSLLEWHVITSGIDGREERPDWVFGERSLPKDPDNITKKFGDSSFV